MSYFRKPYSGLGDVSSCGADQVWDPNISFFGTQGQCMPRANYTPDQLVNPNVIPGVVKTKGGGGSAAGDFFKNLLGGLAAGAATPAQVPVIIAPAQSGMSTTTKLALAGGAALLLVALLAKR